jgi:glycosyltransferase involved in cell wall biosynthesis
MKKRVAFLSAALIGGGAERCIINLVTEFSKKNLIIDLLVIDGTGLNSLELPTNINLIIFNSNRVLTCIPELLSYLKFYRPDVLFSAMDYVNLISIFVKFISFVPTKFVVSIHAQLHFFYGEKRSLKSILNKVLLKLAYSYADEIITVSSGLKKELNDILKIKNNVTVIYNPVINQNLFDLSNEFDDHPWISSDSHTLIVSIGRLSPEKDFPTLIYAFNNIKNHKNIKLLILGEGSERKNLENLIISLDLQSQIQMLGFLKNPYPILKRASCFVLASKSEGFGNVLVESLALGCPVVSTDCPYGPNEILDGGSLGCLVPIGDHITMSNSIIKIIKGEYFFDFDLINKKIKIFHSDSVSEKYFSVFFKN